MRPSDISLSSLSLGAFIFEFCIFRSFCSQFVPKMLQKTFFIILPILAGITTSSSNYSHVLKWSKPDFSALVQRQSGYHPEAGVCEDGNTCVDACGDGYETCPANTDLVLFCFNPRAGQKCCGNSDGRACDPGYYCTRDNSDKTWCCESNLDIAQCASQYGISALYTEASTTLTPTLTPLSQVEPSTTTTSPSTTPITTPFINSSQPINNSNQTVVTAQGSKTIRDFGLMHTFVWCFVILISTCWVLVW
ncbi:hypothetical protein QBC38DRAFT_488525 [Podospora fimiseda]|uniref:Uncharacterized protein n=1 Tax=Podospora fimiseda TaxID=252190 RepID=A0AAN6YU68_9PEZI|nr:hypothetical protein QBC38DRAFT_488525 [Podospora fimiseda]